MIGEMFGGRTELRNTMGPEPGLDKINSPIKTTRSHTQINPGNETEGVCEKTSPQRPIPLDTADFVRDVLLKQIPRFASG
jgi:hypothetical protein